MHFFDFFPQDEKYLRLVLRGTRYRIDRSKRIIEGWNTTRSLCPEFYDGWDVEEPTNKHLIEIGYRSYEISQLYCNSRM